MVPARWAGVPFVMKAGKALNERKVEIRVQFKPPAAGIHKNSLNEMRNELVVRAAGGFMCGPSRPRANVLRSMRRCCTLLCLLYTAGGVAWPTEQPTWCLRWRAYRAPDACTA